MASGNFMYGSYSIPYSDTGKGKMIVLLHGFAETSNVWKNQIDFLENNYRVIAPEIPNVGAPLAGAHLQPEQATENTGHPQGMPLQTPALFASIDAMGDAVAALIQSIAKEPVILLGHSMGGYITLAVAEKNAHLLKAFGLIHSTAFADTEEKKETRRKNIAFIQKNGAEAFLKTATPGLFSEQSGAQHQEWIDDAIKMGTDFSPEVLIAGYEAMMARPDRTSILRGSKLPVLFIIGMEDKAAPADDLLKQVHLPEVSYFHLLENVAHMGMWEAADKVNSFIQKFIEDCD